MIYQYTSYRRQYSDARKNLHKHRHQSFLIKIKIKSEFWAKRPETPLRQDVTHCVALIKKI